MTAEKYGCDYLNDVVKQISQEACSKKEGTIPAIEFTAAKAINYEVYEERDDRVTYTLWVACAFMLYTAVPKMSYLELALTTMFSYFISDIYGGIVHIVLDHTDVIYYKIPDLWRPALEFQWHHWIPHDIVDKPFMCVLGDMNRAVPLHVLTVLVSGYCYGFDDPIYHYFFACRLLMAYAGQLSHRLAHCTTTERPGFARLFQFLFMKKVDHQMHHKDHSKNFAIMSGLSNPWLNSLTKTIGLKTVWPYIFMLGCFTFFDNHVVSHKLVPLLTSIF